RRGHAADDRLERRRRGLARRVRADQAAVAPRALAGAAVSAMGSNGVAHPVLTSLRGGMCEDEAGWIRHAVADVEAALAAAREACAAPGVSDGEVTLALRAAQTCVDGVVR